MRSGTKNTPVDIYQVTEVPNPIFNNPEEATILWKGGVFANVIARRGREQEVAGQIVAKAYTRFEFDYFDVVGIKPNFIIYMNDGVYDIEAILPDEGTKEYIIVDGIRRVPGTDRP